MSLFIEQRGNPAGQPLVLLHGWGLSSEIWQSWLPALEPQFQLLLIDLPGLGRSRFEGDAPYCLDAVAQQIIEQTADLFDRPPIWLGWSLGGIVAAKVVATLAAQSDRDEPPRVAGLITIATSPCFVQQADWPAAMPVETFAAFQQALACEPLKTLNRFAMLQGQGDPQARGLLRTLKAVIAKTAAQPSLQLAETLALLAADYRPLYAELTLPRLFLFAEHDALVPAAVARQPLLSDHAVLIDGAGHVPFITAQPSVSQRINDWIQELADD